MSSRIVPFLLILVSSVSLSQTVSTRLSGMGYLSIAVPDTESEAFGNPAKSTRIDGNLLRLNPYYEATSSEFSQESSAPTQMYSSGSYGTSVDYSRYGLPVGFIAPSGGFRFGFSATSEALTSKNPYHSTNTGPYPSSTNQSDDFTSSYRFLTLLGAVDLGWGSLGVLASWSGTPTELHSMYNYISSGVPSTTESKSQNDETGYLYKAGLLFGSSEETEIDLTLVRDGYHVESKNTLSLYNGVPQNPGPQVVNYTTAARNGFAATVRKSIAEGILAGVRVGYFAGGIDYSVENQWYDAGSMSSIYEERKDEHDDSRDFEIGAGLSHTIAQTALIGVEYVYAPSKVNATQYATTNGTYSDGRPYSRGDIAGKAEYKTVQQGIRFGAEVQLTTVITARAGAETVWSSFSSTSATEDNQSSSSSGNTTAHCYGSGGVSLTFGHIRLDYSLGTISSSGTDYQLPTYLADIIFHHAVTVSLKF